MKTPCENNKLKILLTCFFLGSFFLTSLFSCKEKTIIIPDSVLPKDTMAAILFDMQLLEAIKVKKGVNDSAYQDTLLVQCALIFKKHKVSKEEFEQSLAFYKSNPQFLSEIYDMTINELSRMQAMAGKINTSREDSIKKSGSVPKKTNPEQKKVAQPTKPKKEKKKIKSIPENKKK